MIVNPIAHIKSDFTTKFGLPRQSGIIEGIKSLIVFEKDYSAKEAFRGLENFSHIWIIWGFSENTESGWSPTVRPPRLGGNQRVGVFATRSPFRPNGLGMSSVKLGKIGYKGGNAVIEIFGADMMDGTPVYDIKPYIPYTDSHPEAAGSFAEALKGDKLEIIFPEELRKKIPSEKAETLTEVLKEDPRPSYQNDPERMYGFPFAGYEVRFKAKDGILTVCSIEKSEDR